MDQANRFATRTAYLLLRLEYGVATAVCAVLFLLHIDEVRWWAAIALFAYIDVIGYLPGLYQHIRTGSVPKHYYVLYNVMHSFTTQGAVIGIWVLVFGFEWALLVIPIHLFGDRALFGSFIKSFAVPFEPKQPIPEFAEFEDRLAARASG
ncbi:hypothetical protein [Nocardia cyriacigeorgica]|jgi:hypothetical protein|uniref:hypothetical protein n=1 Tax=Nocardia cyriacigeorgica TaxID=135487 RepID=UPI000CEA5CD7|nr:hypothetical protein [Nocardia cyriacigeorgica]AVH21832.1 hypothetical protein C5B73_10605 [Nocardia cyriacigeorgica]MBF6321339.1 hypothetical protein [Nocardia cyriacigeorgica]MBF6412619.1 hypothetical protein [Nocardia cyriacigeorgica]PPJ09665.1 hypothetical protein C5E43_15190 [Nocardia cyriacigeorgica]